RFHELAEAYGGDLARWPGAQRDAARAFAQARPELADAALAAARGLDAALAADEVGAPTSQLTQAIVAAGMEHRRPARAWRWAAGLGLGLGLAAAGAA